MGCNSLSWWAVRGRDKQNEIFLSRDVSIYTYADTIFAAILPTKVRKQDKRAWHQHRTGPRTDVRGQCEVVGPCERGNAPRGGLWSDQQTINAEINKRRGKSEQRRPRKNDKEKVPKQKTSFQLFWGGIFRALFGHIKW